MIMKTQFNDYLLKQACAGRACKGLEKHKKPHKYIMGSSSQVADYVIGKARHLYLK